MVDFLNRFFQSVFPNPNYRVVVALLFLVVVALAWSLLIPKFKEQRANLVLGIVIIGLLLMVMATAVEKRWQWIVGLLPTLMVGYQLFFLWLYHPREVDGFDEITSGQSGNLQLSEQSYKRAHDSISSHFSLRTLFTRYGLPAVLLGITGMVISDLLVDPQKYFSLIQFVGVANGAKIMLGLKLGTVGAYIYVLLELGRRTFRHDITGAVAMWCWGTLVLGPLLAATVAYLWHIDAPSDSGWWAGGVVLFFAGFAPRRIIAAIEQAAIQLLSAGSPKVVDARLIPLSKIRGISPEVEERVGEEGILDVNSLASAEPVRLVRNTSFDMRQILSWVDEAILIVTLPRSWEGLEEEGITGAIDLAWYYDKVIDPATKSVKAPIPDQIVKLTTKAKLDDPANLIATIQRLYEDTQVQYIWALYNSFTEHSGGETPKPNGSGQGSSTIERPFINDSPDVSQN
jgi:Ca2+/Na+ antiporter